MLDAIVCVRFVGRSEGFEKCQNGTRQDKGDGNKQMLVFSPFENRCRRTYHSPWVFSPLKYSEQSSLLEHRNESESKFATTVCAFVGRGRVKDSTPKRLATVNSPMCPGLVPAVSSATTMRRARKLTNGRVDPSRAAESPP